MKLFFKKIILLIPVIFWFNVPVSGKSVLRIGNVIVNEDSSAITLPLFLTNEEEVAGFEFTITDDAAAVKIDTVFPAGRASGYTALHRNNKVILFNLAGVPVEPGDDKIADIYARIERENMSGIDTIRFTAGAMLADRAGESISEIQTIPGIINFDLISGINEQTSPIPTVYALQQNYPNPFNNSTLLKYELPVAGKIELIIYNSQGQKVRTLEHGNRDAGKYLSRWDGRNDSGQPVASGLYLCTFRVKEKNIVLNRKMMYLR